MNKNTRTLWWTVWRTTGHWRKRSVSSLSFLWLHWSGREVPSLRVTLWHQNTIMTIFSCSAEFSWPIIFRMGSRGATNLSSTHHVDRVRSKLKLSRAPNKKKRLACSSWQKPSEVFTTSCWPGASLPNGNGSQLSITCYIDIFLQSIF